MSNVSIPDDLRAKVEAHGQRHVLDFFEELDERERGELLEQIGRIDFDLLDVLRSRHLDSPEKSASGAELAPASFIRLPRSDEERAAWDRARDLGEEMLRSGRVAAFVVAGGQGSRLDFDGPKGAFEIGPVSNRSLFQIHAEKILALGRRHGVQIPWLVMTSPVNHDATVDFLHQHDHFGLAAEDVRCFQQEMLPAVDRDGKLLLEEKGRIFVSPNGHGGSIKALHDSGALTDLEHRGVDTIFYFQVDNPLLQMCDPVFLGFHACENAEMSSKVVRKTGWSEKVGVVGRRNGRLTVVEYSDLTETEARTTVEDGSLKYWAGSVAIHVLSTNFVASLNAGGFRLPYHRAEKAIPYIDASGQRCDPDGKNGVKFETFVFDALGEARHAATLEAARKSEFSPVKNARGEDSIETSRKDLTSQYLRWLDACGAQIERDPEGNFQGHVEISPLTALDETDLRDHIEPGTVVRDGFII